MGGDYRFFVGIVESLMTEFCRNCEITSCDEDGPASPSCPCHEEWAGIYDDFDQLIGRVTLPRGRKTP